MRRLLLVGVTALALPAAAQTTTLDVTLSHAPIVGGFAGDDLFIEPRATVLGVEASRMLGRMGATDLRLGGVLRGAVTEVFEDGRQPPALHHAEVHVAGRRALSGGTVEALVGVSLDAGPDLFENGFGDDASVSTDGVHALRLGVRADRPFGAFDLSAGAGTYLVPVRRDDVPVLGPDGEATGETFTIRTRWGHAVNLHIGATRRVGAADVGVALVSAQRTAGSSSNVDQPSPFDRIDPISVLSVVPSVAWRGPGGVVIEAALRSPGVVWLEHADLGVPLTVSNTRVARFPLSLRVGYAW